MNRNKSKKSQDNLKTGNPNKLSHSLPNEATINLPVSENIVEYNMSFVPAQSYELLKQENFQLKQELNNAKQELTSSKQELQTQVKTSDSLRNDVAQLTATITHNNTEIELLRRENAELKEELAQIKRDNKNLHIKMDKLTIDNQTIRNEMHDKQLSLKLIATLQDLNANDELEKNMKRPMKKLMARLRDGRNRQFHYIDNTGVMDYLELATYKKHMTLQKLQNLTPEFKSNFEKSLGQGIIQGVIEYLKQKLPVVDFQNQVDQEDREIAEEWWTD
jgi:hypothetical protein